MRLTRYQIMTILDTTHDIMGHDARVIVFGSRLDDQRRGGDLDLVVETATRPALLQCAELKLRLENTLQMPVDIVARARNDEPSAFQRLAMACGTELEPIT
jgi:predicted nucleotidyltransferase